MASINWSNTASEDDIQDARAYLRLLGFEWGLNPESVTIPAKDILRASGNMGLILPKENAGVKKYLEKIKKGETISRVLLVQGSRQFPLIIAEGYHRVCAAWHIGEATPVACVMEMI